MPGSRPMVTLTTDFGYSDPYVAVIKGVLFRINPDILLVDLTHDVEPQNIIQAAFLLHSSYRFFAGDTIHLAIVDPGVGSSRKAVMLETPFGRFIGPDNGLFTFVLRDFGAEANAHDNPRVSLPSGCNAFDIVNSHLWLNPPSATFHGRDIFAPVTAQLSLGVSPLELGRKMSNLMSVNVTTPCWDKNDLLGSVVHIDRFGNLITNISSQLLEVDQHIEVLVRDECISGLNMYYSQRKGLMALISSYNTLEIAIGGGNAAETLGVGFGEQVRVRRRTGIASLRG